MLLEVANVASLHVNASPCNTPFRRHRSPPKPYPIMREPGAELPIARNHQLMNRHSDQTQQRFVEMRAQAWTIDRIDRDFPAARGGVPAAIGLSDKVQFGSVWSSLLRHLCPLFRQRIHLRLRSSSAAMNSMSMHCINGAADRMRLSASILPSAIRFKLNHHGWGGSQNPVFPAPCSSSSDPWSNLPQCPMSNAQCGMFNASTVPSPLLVNSFSEKSVSASVSVWQRAAASGRQEYGKARSRKRRAKITCYKKDRSLNHGCRPSPPS